LRKHAILHKKQQAYSTFPKPEDNVEKADI
jgi:hypothetical protein